MGDVTCVTTVFPMDLLVHGGATGADMRAAAWAASLGIHCARIDALWGLYEKKAGYLRNMVMAKLLPYQCIALPGGKGTAMMVGICERFSIPIWRPYS